MNVRVDSTLADQSKLKKKANFMISCFLPVLTTAYLINFRLWFLAVTYF